MEVMKMAGRLDPIGVASKRLRKARKKTFGDIRKAKIETKNKIARIQGDILNPFG